MAQHAFPSGEALARKLANDVTAALERRLAAHGAAGLVVSGGRTPAAFLRELGSRELDWSNVFVTLADERCVAADDPASNLRLLREAFAGAPASARDAGRRRRNRCRCRLALERGARGRCRDHSPQSS